MFETDDHIEEIASTHPGSPIAVDNRGTAACPETAPADHTDHPAADDEKYRLPPEGIRQKTKRTTKKLLDFSDCDTHIKLVDALKRKLDAGDLTEVEHEAQEVTLYRFTYLDLMERIMTVAEEFILKNPDETYDEIYEHIVYSNSYGKLEPSQFQQDLIKEAVENYVVDRAIIRGWQARFKLKGNQVGLKRISEARKEFLKSIGLGHLKVQDVEFILDHPVGIGIRFKKATDFQEAYLEKKLSKATEEELKDIDSIRGFYRPAGNPYTDKELNGKVYYLRSDATPEVQQHEIRHLMNHQYYDPAIYEWEEETKQAKFQDLVEDFEGIELVDKLEAEGFIGLPEDMDEADKIAKAEDIESLEKYKARLMDELTCYLEHDYRDDPKGLIYEEFEDVEFNFSESKVALRQIFDAVIGELKRLESEGYPAKEIYQKFQSSTDIYTLMQRLYELGDPAVVNPARLEAKLRNLADNGYQNIREILPEEVEVDGWTHMVIPPWQRIDNARKLQADGMRNMAEVLRVQEELRKTLAEFPADRVLVEDFDPTTGEVLTWEARLTAANQYFETV